MNKYHEEVARREALAKSSKEELEALRKEGAEAAQKANSQANLLFFQLHTPALEFDLRDPLFTAC